MTDKEELDKSLGRLNQAGVVHVALTFLNGLIEDNEKLRMSNDLVKSNNKKIKKALEVIDVWFDDRYQLDIIDWKLMTEDLEKIKKILEE